MSSGTAAITVGYARVSTGDQNPALQEDALRHAGCDRIITERASGVRERPGLQRTLDLLRTGDTLVVWRIDRLGRSTGELVTLVNTLSARGIHFRSLTEGIDTTTAGGELVFTIFAAVAQMERRVIVERTHAGLAAARARGRIGGRPRALTEAQARAVRAAHGDGQTVIELAHAFGVSRATIYRTISDR